MGSPQLPRLGVVIHSTTQKKLENSYVGSNLFSFVSTFRPESHVVLDYTENCDSNSIH
jgi:hypothetical protein